MRTRIAAIARITGFGLGLGPGLAAAATALALPVYGDAIVRRQLR